MNLLMLLLTVQTLFQFLEIKLPGTFPLPLIYHLQTLELRINFLLILPLNRLKLKHFLPEVAVLYQMKLKFSITKVETPLNCTRIFILFYSIDCFTKMMCLQLGRKLALTSCRGHKSFEAIKGKIKPLSLS